jgi:integrase
MWLDSVAVSHSGASGTQTRYRNEIMAFLKYIDATPEDIMADYKSMNERDFRQKYAQHLKAYLGTLMRQGYAPGSISNFVYGVLSFFKHSDLPIGFVPPVRYRTIFHNRDIEAAEIVKILEVSAPREKAFYTFMAQSGLRPTTICNLQLKHIERDFSNGKVPCLVNVPEEITKGQYHGYISFIGEDAVRYLKAYLNTRRTLTKDSYLFVNYGTENRMIFNTVSSLFRKAVRILKEKGEMDYEQKKADRPAEIRLYNLRKFFRKMANQAGFENVEYWMGHTGPGVDASYRPKDHEFYRKIYAEKAMPFLRLETNTPTETEKTIETLKEQITKKDQKLLELEQKIMKFEPLFELLSNTPNLELLLKDMKQGRYAAVESESSLTMQIPKRVIEKLAKQAEAKGEDRVELTIGQLKKMSIEDSEKDKDRDEETERAR